MLQLAVPNQHLGSVRIKPNIRNRTGARAHERECVRAGGRGACLLERQGPSNGSLDLGADLHKLQAVQSQVCQAVILTNLPLLQTHQLQHRCHQALQVRRFTRLNLNFTVELISVLLLFQLGMNTLFLPKWARCVCRKGAPADKLQVVLALKK